MNEWVHKMLLRALEESEHTRYLSFISSSDAMYLIRSLPFEMQDAFSVKFESPGRCYIELKNVEKVRLYMDMVSL